MIVKYFEYFSRTALLDDAKNVQYVDIFVARVAFKRKITASYSKNTHTFCLLLKSYQ